MKVVEPDLIVLEYIELLASTNSESNGSQI